MGWCASKGVALWAASQLLQTGARHHKALLPPIHWYPVPLRSEHIWVERQEMTGQCHQTWGRMQPNL